MTPQEFNKAMGAIIRQQRLARGLTQEVVGAALGVTFQQIQKYERGSNGLAAHYVPTLASLFGISVEQLYAEVGGTPPGAPTEADSDGFLAARYVSRIADPKLRSNVVDFTRKLAYWGSAA